MEKPNWCNGCEHLKEGGCVNPSVNVTMRLGRIESCDGKSTPTPPVEVKPPETVEEFFNQTRSAIDLRLSMEIEKIEDPKEREKFRWVVEGGKRLRPTLTILTYMASGGNPANLERVLETAISIEKQHVASLVLDDIVDKDMTRRGRLSFPAKFGLVDAVLFPIEIIYSGLRMLSPPHHPEVPRTIFEVGATVIQGQTQELKMRKLLEEIAEKAPVLGSEYFATIQMKTASVFGAASKLGVVEAGKDKELQDLFWRFGNEVGMAYQLADDLVDLSRGRLDLKKMVVALGGQLDMFLRGTGDFTPLDLEGNVSTFLKNELKKRIEKAEKLAEQIPETPHTPILKQAPRYIVDSMLKEGGLNLE